MPSLLTIVWNWKLKYPEYAVMLVLDGSIPSLLLVEVLFRICFFFTFIQEGDAIIEYLGHNPEHANKLNTQ